MFSRPKILFLAGFLAFCSTIKLNPYSYLPFEFLNFLSFYVSVIHFHSQRNKDHEVCFKKFLAALLCCLPRVRCLAAKENFTYIHGKTAATNAQPLACTATLTPEVILHADFSVYTF